ncbi:unnamed protein product [Pleuronectes platessa]|uniref:Uncharacterized protein n=1 Tax=Pleuronectes platessa TaxID=8262 RepID=A0A9N7Y3L0_PLEPL|nr:unnamed protein product [Pleuronectes platessa]
MGDVCKEPFSVSLPSPSSTPSSSLAFSVPSFNPEHGVTLSALPLFPINLPLSSVRACGGNGSGDGTWASGPQGRPGGSGQRICSTSESEREASGERELRRRERGSRGGENEGAEEERTREQR